MPPAAEPDVALPPVTIMRLRRSPDVAAPVVPPVAVTELLLALLVAFDGVLMLVVVVCMLPLVAP